MCYVSIIMSRFALIPDVVWAAIGGSALTLLGVFVQLRHDAKQRNKERAMNLRREVYLPAAELMAAAIGYVGKLPNADFDEQGVMEPIQNLIAVVAKINIVGSDETVTASNILLGKFNSLITQLMSEKLPIIKIKKEIKTLETIIKNCQDRRTVALADMKSLNFNKETDRGLWQLVQTQFDHAQEEETKYQKELDEKRDQWAKLSFNMLAECVGAAGQIQKFITPVLIALRKELNLPLNQEQYKKINEQIGNENKQAFDKFIADMKKDIGTSNE